MVLNLHGLYGKSCNTAYKELTHLGKQIMSPQFHYEDKDPLRLRHDLLAPIDFEYVVGTSFGGFLALVVSAIRNIPCILINPCIPPATYIEQLVPGYRYTDVLVNMMPDEISAPIFVILGSDDDVICKDTTIAQLAQLRDDSNNSNIYVNVIPGGHKLSGKQFSDMFRKGVETIENIKKA